MKKLIFLLSLIYFTASAQKINLTPENAIALEATEKVDEIFDGNLTEKVIDRGIYGWILPIPILIDLNGIYNVNEIKVYDMQAWSGGTGLKIYAGNDPFNLTYVYDEPLSGANVWSSKTVNLQAVRYIRIDAVGVKSWFSEVGIHGTKVSDVAPVPAKNFTPPNYAMEKRIGGKCFIDDPKDKIEQVYGFPNDYMNWQWFEEKENVYRFTNSALGNLLAWRDYWKSKGFDWLPVLKEVPVWFRIAKDGIVQRPMVQPIREPYDKPEDKLDVHKPETHAAVFKDWLEFLEEYLKAVQPDELILFNETDKLWDGRKSWSKPWELAAVMIQSQKVRDRVSPHTKLHMGGLAGLNLDYLKSMKIYCDKYNGGKFCSDAVVVHHYSNNQGGQMTDLENPPSKRVGISPEDDDLRSKGRKIVEWGHTVAGVPVYLLEFGFDTNPGSVQTAGTETRQRDWLIRNYAACLEAGFDRCAHYMLRNPGKVTSTGQHSTPGLTTEKGEWKEKPSYFAMKEYLAAVRGKKYIGEQRQSGAYIQQFSDGVNSVWKYWTNTGTVHVNINGNNLTATETPKFYSAAGAPQPIPGCMDQTATNYNPSATVNDGSCTYDTPLPNDLIIEYSFTNTRDNPQLLKDTLPEGIIYVFANKPGEFVLTKNGQVIFTQIENVPFYDLGGTDDKTGLAKPTTFSAGNYTLIFEGATVSFVVVSETTPPPTPVFGCMDSTALNYNPLATVDNGSCNYPIPPPPPPPTEKLIIRVKPNIEGRILIEYDPEKQKVVVE